MRPCRAEVGDRSTFRRRPERHVPVRCLPTGRDVPARARRASPPIDRGPQPERRERARAPPSWTAMAARRPPRSWRPARPRSGPRACRAARWRPIGPVAEGGDGPPRGVQQGHRVGRPKRKPLPRARLVGVDDGVHQAARGPHHGHRAVAHRDELALARGLEAGGHQEHVRPGVDAARLVPVEALEDGDPVGCAAASAGALRRGWVAGAQDDQPGAASMRPGAAQDTRSKPFWGSSRPMTPITGPVRVDAQPGAPQVVPAGRLAGRVRRRNSRPPAPGRVAGSHSSGSTPFMMPMYRSPRSRRMSSSPRRTPASATRGRTWG